MPLIEVRHKRKPYREWRGKRLPPNVHVYYDRLGKLRNYYRVGAAKMAFGPGIEPLSKEWWEGYLAAKAGDPLPIPGRGEKVQTRPGSWTGLIAHYKLNNTGWRAMKAGSTQAGYLPYLDTISRIFGPHKVAMTEARHVKELIAKVQYGDPDAADEKRRKPRPGTARILRTVFSLLFEHARRDLHWVGVNPVRDIEKPKLLNKAGHHTLTETEIEALRRAHPDYASDERAFLEIGIACGARAGDLCGLGFKNIAGGVVSFTPVKENSTGAEVVLPVEGEHLLAALTHRSKTDTFFFQQPPRGSNQHNRQKLIALKPEPWSYTRARKTWKDMRDRAGIGDEPTIHSMRKCFATRMANSGANPQDIADALGDTLASAMIYTQKRDKRAGYWLTLFLG
jgi:integrase